MSCRGPATLALRLFLATSLLSTAHASTVNAQFASTPFPSWRPPAQDARPESPRVSLGGDDTVTGLLIGAAVGAAATTMFLVVFCGGSDTRCQADEVGRAALIIGVPFAAVGALIGALAD